MALDNVTPTRPLANPFTVVQIALAVKDVPFDEIVFVQYPAFRRPTTPTASCPMSRPPRCCGRPSRATALCMLTGEVGANGGVVDVTEPAPDGETPAATPARAAPTPGATPVGAAVELPESIIGSTAAQQTCSGGNVR